MQQSQNDDLTQHCVLPGGWSFDSIGNLFDIRQGKSLARHKQTGKQKKKFLRTANVLWGKVDLSEVDEMDFSPSECEALALRPGDLLVCEGGDIGRTAVWRGELGDCYYQNHLHRLRVKDGGVNPHFVMFWMQAAITQLRVYEGFGNKTTIPNLSRSRLSEFTIPVPEESEQKKIAAVLWKIQKAVKIEDAVVRNARDLKKSLLRHLFTHGLSGADSIELDNRKVPAHWRPCRFRDFATLHRGYDLPVQDRLDGTVPIVGSNGIVGYHSVAKLKGPGVATGRSGTMGLSFYIESDYWPLNTALYVQDFHSNNPLFIHYFFQFFDFKRYAAGVSVPTLNRNLVHEAIVAIPDQDEQREIASTLQTVDRKIDIHESKKRSLQDLFKTMLHKLMTAQIRINDLDIDTSEVEMPTK